MAKLETQCSKCGKMKFANPKAYATRIAKFGSLEEIAKNWVCRECSNLNKEPKIKKVKTGNPGEILDELEPEKKSYKPFTKEMQLGKKPLKVAKEIKTEEELKEEAEEFINKR